LNIYDFLKYFPLFSEKYQIVKKNFGFVVLCDYVIMISKNDKGEIA